MTPRYVLDLMAAVRRATRRCRCSTKEEIWGHHDDCHVPPLEDALERALQAAGLGKKLVAPS